MRFAILTPESNFALTHAHIRQTVFREIVGLGFTAEEIASVMHFPLEEVQRDLTANLRAAVDHRTQPIVDQLQREIMRERALQDPDISG